MIASSGCPRHPCAAPSALAPYACFSSRPYGRAYSLPPLRGWSGCDWYDLSFDRVGKAQRREAPAAIFCDRGVSPRRRRGQCALRRSAPTPTERVKKRGAKRRQCVATRVSAWSGVCTFQTDRRWGNITIMAQNPLQTVLPPAWIGPSALQSRYCLHSWGVAPGWYRSGLRPSRDCADNSSHPNKRRRRRGTMTLDHPGLFPAAPVGRVCGRLWPGLV